MNDNHYAPLLAAIAAAMQIHRENEAEVKAFAAKLAEDSGYNAAQAEVKRRQEQRQNYLKENNT